MNTAPTNFGVDVSCVTSLRTGRYASGLRLVAEAVYRRVTTPKGTLQGGEDELNYGIDIAGLLGSLVTASQIAAAPGQIEAEIMKDERIASVEVTINSVKSGPSVAWTVSIDCETTEGPFSLQLAVSGVTTSLLGITTGSTT